MTDDTGLRDIVERVEAAQRPDRELDAAIYFAVECSPIPADGITLPWLTADVTIYPGTGGYYFLHDGVPSDGTLAPAYTASLDAAMTLLNGSGVLLGLSDIGADGLPLARVGRSDTGDVFTGIASCIMTDTSPVAGLAIALVSAALKSRMGGER